MTFLRDNTWLCAAIRREIVLLTVLNFVLQSVAVDQKFILLFGAYIANIYECDIMVHAMFLY